MQWGTAMILLRTSNFCRHTWKGWSKAKSSLAKSGVELGGLGLTSQAKLELHSLTLRIMATWMVSLTIHVYSRSRHKRMQIIYRQKTKTAQNTRTAINIYPCIFQNNGGRGGRLSLDNTASICPLHSEAPTNKCSETSQMDPLSSSETQNWQPQPKIQSSLY